jgi:hypothetical protein
MAQRQMLLDAARKSGATHIAIVDADEILTANLLPSIRSWCESTAPGQILQLPWVCVRGEADYHATGIWSEQQVSTSFLDAPHLHWSSAGRGGYDFHHRHPMGQHMEPRRMLAHVSQGGLMHLQFASDRRLRAKQALYKLTESLRWPGREVNQLQAVDERYNPAVYGQHTTPGSRSEVHPSASAGLANMKPEWWSAYANLMQYYRPDAEPWQEAEVRRLVAEHGRDRFAGLDLFGVA